MFFREIKEIRKTKPTAWDYLNSGTLETPGLEGQAEIIIYLKKLYDEVESLMTESEKTKATQRITRIERLFGNYPLEFLLESQMFYKECIEKQFNESLFK